MEVLEEIAYGVQCDLRGKLKVNDITDAIIKKRNVFDIPDNIFRCLSIKAAAKGMNLKDYIEGLLEKDVEDMVGNIDDVERLLIKRK